MRNAFWRGCLSLAVVTGLVTSVQAQNEQRQRRTGPFVIADHLDNPSGIAIHPETGEIFVAEHPGVMRFTREGGNRGQGNRQRGQGRRGLQSKMQIGSYPSDVYGKGPKYDIGPLGVAFLDAKHLVVGDGSRPDGEELIRVYEIGDTAPDEPTAEGDAVATFGPIKAGDASAKGEGNYYGVATKDGMIYATANGDDTKGWVVRAKFENGQAGELETFIATKEILGTDAPCGIAIGPAGDLVISQMGEISVPGDSLLTIYNPESGELLAKYETGLNDIIALAYSPDNKLYAVDFSWIDASQGGLFELTVEGDKCNARKVMSLDKPTALAFSENGGLYVTVFGTAEEGSDEKPGQLLRIRSRDLTGDNEN